MNPEHLSAADQIGFPILSLLIMLPLAWGLLLPFLRTSRAVRIAALTGAGLELILSLLMLASLRPEVAGMQLMERAAWIPSLNAQYLLGIDGLAALFPPLTALLFCGVILASWTSIQTMPRLYFALLLALEGITMGVFCALDLVLFFLFWELTLAPIYFLISLWGIGPERRFAATKYTLFMLAGGIPLLFAILLLGLHHASAVELPLPGGLTFDYLALIEQPLPAPMQAAVFLLLFFGFAVKAPLFPFHTWLPTVLREGPVGLSALLVGLKLGAFGILRFALPLAPMAAREYFWLMAALGGFGAIYGALVALRQSNLRKMLAFSSVSHVGLVIVGIAAMNIQGVQGAIFQLVNFGVVAGGLVLLTGFLHHRLGSTDLASLGGLARPLPLLTAFFLLLGMASIGLPGTSGFVAELLILIGIFQASPGVAFIALFGVILSAAYFLGFFQRAFLGPITQPAVAAALDLRPRELLIAGVLGVLVLMGGLFPGLAQNVTTGAANGWVVRMAADQQQKASSMTGYNARRVPKLTSDDAP
ncbi:MAG TPA: NADH-quinone oxidoreductase subunit M [Candidatus Contendobacter sp.]|nr:NADH-quinone oxidoreductase subunit M [Candidatus Contendobacter sp.]HRD48607.1 NADH-quinone oxidoreductase subunit M [Candidatus Contendobacter sp.]